MMNLVLPLLNVGLMTWLSWMHFRRHGGGRTTIYWWAISLRILGGVALGLLYFFHYGVGDTLSYWEDGKLLAKLFADSPGPVAQFYWNDFTSPEIVNALDQQTPRSIFFVKICGVLFRRLTHFFPESSTAAAISLLFFPSVVFWSSGLIKESLGLAALFILAGGCLAIVMGQRLTKKEMLMLLVSLWMGWNLKYYWIGIFLPAVFPVLVLALASRRFPSLKRYDLIAWVFLFGVLLFAATHTHPNFYVSRFLEVIYHNNLEFTRMSDPPRIVQYFNLEPEAASILMNAPAALVAGLFRPFAWEAFNTLSWIAAIENLLVLLLVLQSLLAVKYLFRSGSRVLLLSTVAYVLLLITFLALSTPNFGTLSRYRIGALPFAVMLCLLPVTPAGKWLSGRKWFG
jgi:hypothetical protein